MQRDHYGKIGIECFECRSVARMINGIKPDFFREWRTKHGCVVGCVERTKARSERAYSLVAVDLEIKNSHGQRVAGFCAFDVERSSQRIVPLHHAEGVTRF